MKAINNEVLEPLLPREAVQTLETKEWGSEKWYAVLRAVGPHVAGQGNTQGFLTRSESFGIKTLTKETLGEDGIKGWRGLHQESKQNCYTSKYLAAPWVRIADPCNMFDHVDGEGAWVCCWLPCCIALCPCTLTVSLLGCLIGAGRDGYNFSKKGLVRPLDDNKGIKLGLFPKQPVRGPEIQVMQEAHLCSTGS